MSEIFLSPGIDRSGTYSFWPLRLFVHKNFTFAISFYWYELKPSYFMSIACDKTFTLVPSSSSSVEVKYQGHSF